jgi:hypothetical protein
LKFKMCFQFYAKFRLLVFDRTEKLRCRTVGTHIIIILSVKWLKYIPENCDDIFASLFTHGMHKHAEVQSAARYRQIKCLLNEENMVYISLVNSFGDDFRFSI